MIPKLETEGNEEIRLKVRSLSTYPEKWLEDMVGKYEGKGLGGEIADSKCIVPSNAGAYERRYIGRN